MPAVPALPALVGSASAAPPVPFLLDKVLFVPHALFTQPTHGGRARPAIYFGPVVAAFLFAAAASAQTVEPQPGVSPTGRRALLAVSLAPKEPIAGVTATEVILGPHQPAPLHAHPCHVVGVIHEGVVTFQLENMPAQTLRPGDAFYEPAGVRVLRFDNEGEVPVRFAAFYLLAEPGQETVRILKQQ